MNCGGGFWSWGAENRICDRCKGDEEYQATSGLIDAGAIDLYNHPLGEEDDGDNFKGAPAESFWEVSKKKDAKKLKCPECGKIVYRPGTADQHGCFRFDQDLLTQKEQSIRRSLSGYADLSPMWSRVPYRKAEDEELDF